MNKLKSKYPNIDVFAVATALMLFSGFSAQNSSSKWMTAILWASLLTKASA